jgi:TctA family transporter
MERSLLQALTIARGDPGGLWDSPLSRGLLLAAVAVLIAPALVRLVGRRRG